MIGIVLLNYNSWRDLNNCLYSIEHCKLSLPYRIYVIDNNSKQKCDDQLLKKVQSYKNVRFFQNLYNRGYAAGNNIGIKFAIEDNCDAIIISNTDVLYNQGAIEGMYQRLFQDDSIGIVGPQILFNGKPQHITRYCKTDFKQKFFATTFLRRLYPKIEREYYGLDKDEYEESYVHDVSGCCFMLSIDCARDITPLDEHTFLFEEELIIGERCREKKYKVLYYPKVSVIHNHSGSTGTAAAFSYTKGTISEIYYCRKYLNANRIQIIPLYLIRILSYVARMVSIKDYRKNFYNYLKHTCKSLYIPIDSFNSK